MAESCLVLKPAFARLEKKLGNIPKIQTKNPWLNLVRLARHGQTTATIYTTKFYGRRPIDIDFLIKSIDGTFNSLLSILPAAETSFTAQEGKRISDVLQTVLKAFASQLHIYMHHTYQSGRLKKRGHHKHLDKQVRSESRHYFVALKRCQDLIKKEDVAGLRTQAQHIHRHLHDQTVPLLEAVGSTSASDLSKKEYYGLQVSDTARRWIMLLSAILTFSLALQIKSRNAAILKAAKACKKLARRDMQLSSAHERIPAREKKTMKVKGKLNHVKFFKLPKKPFSVANIVGANVYMLVPYKSMMRVGALNGSSIWAVGKRKEFMGKSVFEVEFEGAGQYAKSCWEDYLSDALRGTYNLYPSALRMAWEFPDIRRKDAISDLASRIKN